MPFDNINCKKVKKNNFNRMDWEIKIIANIITDNLKIDV